MGRYKDLDTYFGPCYEAHRDSYLEFLVKAMLYINNVNGVEVFESTYGREFDPKDGYCKHKVKELQDNFDLWFLSLDKANRKRFVEAVMLRMASTRSAV